MEIKGRIISGYPTAICCIITFGITDPFII
jgi:hypothetical protein